MTISNKQIALIKVAVRKLGLRDDTYRAALAQIGGVTTSKDLDKTGFEALLGYFEHCGFKPFEAKGPAYGPRHGMASFAQIELIRNLWAEYTYGAYPGQDELNKWLERCFKVSSLRFLKKDTAPKVITALKAMKLRAA